MKLPRNDLVQPRQQPSRLADTGPGQVQMLVSTLLGLATLACFSVKVLSTTYSDHEALLFNFVESLDLDSNSSSFCSKVFLVVAAYQVFGMVVDQSKASSLSEAVPKQQPSHFKIFRVESLLLLSS